MDKVIIQDYESVDRVLQEGKLFDAKNEELKNWYLKQGLTQSNSSWIDFWGKV